MIRLTLITLACLLTACATCRENKAMCTAVAVGIVAGSIAACSSERASYAHGAVPPICVTNPGACR